MLSFSLLLVVTACLSFFSAWLLLNRLLKAQSTQLQKERLKARVGLANQYAKQKSHSSHCWWCSLGRAIGPKSAKEISVLQRQLVSAGFRHERYIGAYFFIKYGLVLFSAMVMALLWSWQGISVVWILAVPIVLLLLPERILIQMGQTRLAKISHHLPDFLDMCNICMNAGLSYLVAVKRVASELREVHPEICYEFEYLLDQIQLGVPRVEALRQFAERNPTRDIQSLVQVLIQNEKLGSSIGDSLSEFSRRMYSNREQEMEEKAAKASAKMAVVIMPFLMVPYLILLLGEKMVMLGRGF
ncbi:type II secretion system F family protein [Thiomicrorhabdus sp. ZW0627]|uniref:type II secretion system F family protein n=1 Tax=Thiomicrorhabdus sp. ZW0627 TaxID=3039774 RepID=UPI002436FA57|nr:type II secretion system F family protein [Thiomicrorhabdus sp. ZW0627]MDG6774903.1 type II secretion system F family protein [Thiomicrorhabdus sp. ZW0627]